GTVSRPSCWAARQRRSPAMIWCRPGPSRLTRMGWTIPFSRMEAASSSSRAASMPARGWKGLGSRLCVGTSEETSRGLSPSGSGRRAESPLPSAFLFMAHELLGQVQVGLGPLRPDVVEQDRLTEARGLPQADAPRHHRLEHLVLEVR